MSELLTEGEVWRIWKSLRLAGETSLADKVETIARAETKASLAREFALTHRQVVKQMILDSPLGRVPDTAQPLGVVNVAIAFPYLKRLIEAVDSL